MYGKRVCQGEIWWYNPPSDIRELHGVLHGRRPILVLSNNVFNSGGSNVINCLPLSRLEKPSPVHVFLKRYDARSTQKPPKGLILYSSYVLCEQAMTISQCRLQERMGQVTEDEWCVIRHALMDIQYGTS